MFNYFLIYFIYFSKLYKFLYNLLGIGDWGLGIGVWGWGIGANPQSPKPKPQNPIPNPPSPKHIIHI